MPISYIPKIDAAALSTAIFVSIEEAFTTANLLLAMTGR
jgi:hypothetical protein